ncbi:L-lactate permease [Alteromonas mediterranea]|uniref:L-lactate permease n=1 Tax=Alteromonas mediterranea (strain DSM 17117 / CIP 110805 / LMG 28347 / Deep ecotype) TaxID=1774373 RepID=F2GBH9_ALTMD|nr:L-lactate permease [Alteromonas mediterranea]AEA99025.1 lactate permease [Alteromonas mediterranea DE]CAH1208900.1 L-lactate permease [Alteromonas mediterranea]
MNATNLLIAAYAPLFLLIYLMVKPNGMASSKALPLSALAAYLIVIFNGHSSLTLIHASVVQGVLLALTPLSIIAGAIFLFLCMEKTGALATLKNGLNTISSNKVAQLMIVGWAFAFLIEGASGFGTPAAIAAPILFSLGFAPVNVALFCLVTNTIPVIFGAMGTPVWFGMSLLSLQEDTIIDIATLAALISTLVAPAIVFMALRLVIPSWKIIFRHSLFIVSSTCACTLPFFALSFYSVEFPSLLGGGIGLIITVLMAKSGFGLSSAANEFETKVDTQKKTASPSGRELAKASFPLWGTVIMLLLTRLPELGLRSLLQDGAPNITASLGILGNLSVSASLVISITGILGTSIQWKHSVLYVPSLIPFIVVAFASVYSFGSREWVSRITSVSSQTAVRMTKPLFALLGALVFVNLMMLGGEQSAVSVIGKHMAFLAGNNWPLFAPLLGALGSFFSGSATISNLTFAGIQHAIAEQLSLPLPVVLALQSVGAAMGNMVCINNIVAVTAILGLKGQDGVILKKAAGILAIYAILVGSLGACLISIYR